MHSTSQDELKKNGLDSVTASQRLLEDGPNELGHSQRRTLAAIALEVASEPMFLLLLAAGLVYFLMGDGGEALILLGFVFVIMGMTIFQERRTDNALNALRDLSSPRARVVRDGLTVRIAGHAVVRDDVFILAEGDRVPADGVLLQAHELATDESMLTGESLSVAKAQGESVYAGTLVVRGQGLVLVTATGSHTEMGRIGLTLEKITLQTSPLRDEMSRLTKRLAFIGLLLSLALTASFWALRGHLPEAILAGIALAMSVLPQEFPVIMIIFFAFAARRLGQFQVLTRRLSAIETLGETSVLCVDKTGTLTENRMQVSVLYAGDQEFSVTPETDQASLQLQSQLQSQKKSQKQPQALSAAALELLRYAVLASETEPHDPMEIAIHQLGQTHQAHNTGVDPAWTLVREYELSPQLLAMSHVWRSEELSNDVIASKGAPEAVAQLCRLSPAAYERVMQQSAQLAERGLRVLGVARATHRSDSTWPDSQQAFSYEWLGLIALSDPLRPEVPAAIAQCHRAGIRVIMITGDHPRTARAIAAQAGITSAESLTGADMERMDAAALAQACVNVNVFARVKPEQKLALVQALKQQSHVVAMTGDGVNDAPALKAAHIGIAMGQRGTDVAREAASLVLLKDDFNSILQAIHTGRRTFANMRQAMVYTLAVHIPIVGLALLPVIFGLPLMLTPLHIAFLELVIDPACSVVFEAEHMDEGLMLQAPRDIHEPLLNSRHALHSVIYGSLTTIAAFSTYAWLQSQGEAASSASTAAFVVLVVGNAILILPNRSPQLEWRRMWASLPAVSAWVLGISMMALCLVTNVPQLAEAFRFQPLSASAWMLSFVMGVCLLPGFQLIKLALSRRSVLHTR